MFDCSTKICTRDEYGYCYCERQRKVGDTFAVGIILALIVLFVVTL